MVGLTGQVKCPNVAPGSSVLLKTRVQETVKERVRGSGCVASLSYSYSEEGVFLTVWGDGNFDGTASYQKDHRWFVSERNRALRQVLLG